MVVTLDDAQEAANQSGGYPAQAPCLFPQNASPTELGFETVVKVVLEVFVYQLIAAIMSWKVEDLVLVCCKQN